MGGSLTADLEAARFKTGLEMSARLADRDFDVDLAVAPGEVLAVLGPNGAGKSTLLELVAGLVQPDRGTVRLYGRTLTDIARGIAIPPHRRSISLLAQDPLLFPHLSVADNVAFGVRSRGVRARNAGVIGRSWLRAVGAIELAGRRPTQLSGGQAQRVALARALALEPDMVLLDEPMAALDVATAPVVRTVIRQVLRNRCSTTDTGSTTAHRPTSILVTHDIIDALTLADRVVVIESGRIVESGSVAAVLARPRSTFAARIAGVNVILGTAVAVDAPNSAIVNSSTEPAGVERNSVIGTVRSGDIHVHGRLDGAAPGGRAAALFHPTAVAVHRDHPDGSPRNVFRVQITELTDRGGMIRVHTADRSDGTAGLIADLTPAAVAEVGLLPGAEVYFAVKATEVQVYPC